MGKDGDNNLWLLNRIKRSDGSDFNILRYYLSIVTNFCEEATNYYKFSIRLY